MLAPVFTDAIVVPAGIPVPEIYCHAASPVVLLKLDIVVVELVVPV